ncbi:hypothetical protein [Acinetobacter sp. MD2]|uniref:hypothetical protein n=1 Tax=Acinetobacter sp. MD2 TaxID=2600066 RepID=UPI002D1E8054|nr:hypothetical protein [Acinetobacter sp. MD2]MEB3767426.1 hypothetical protein [Acinetobacter sp. MD2]
MFVLEEILKMQSHQLPSNLRLRVERSLSWLKKSNDLAESPDLQLMSLWVAMNALYLQDTAEGVNITALNYFLAQLYQQDQSDKITQVLWQEAEMSLEQWLSVAHTHPMYWDLQHGKITRAEYHESWAAYLDKIKKMEIQQNHLLRLQLTFERLYCYRNQVFFGGMRSQSQVYHQQLSEACRRLQPLILQFVYVMLENADQYRDDPQRYFPVMNLS